MQHLRVLWGQCICSTLGPKLVFECAHPRLRRLLLEAGCLLGDGLTDGQCMPGRQACMDICIHLQRQPQHAHATTPTVSKHCRMPLVLLQVLAGPGRVTSRLTQHRASAGTQGEDTQSVTAMFEKRLFLRKIALQAALRPQHHQHHDCSLQCWQRVCIPCMAKRRMLHNYWCSAPAARLAHWEHMH
jgi:hypothetical protein